MKTIKLTTAIVHMTDLRSALVRRLKNIRARRLIGADFADLPELSEKIAHYEAKSRAKARGECQHLMVHLQVPEVYGRRARDWDGLITVLRALHRAYREEYNERRGEWDTYAHGWPCGYDDMKGEQLAHARQMARLFKVALSQAVQAQRAGMPYPY